MQAGSALKQADLEYRNSDVDQKIQQHISTSQGPSAELDKAFIMGIEIGLSILLSVQSKAFISNFRFNKCAHIRGIVWQFWNFCSHMCEGSVGRVNLCS